MPPRPRSPARSRALALRLSVASLGAVGLGACSAIVAVPPGPVHCEIVDADPCPEGERCLGGVCVEDNCVPGPAELCNGTDDDCDLLIDEGLDQDADGDHYVACNFANPLLQDCDDTNGLIFPHETGRDSRGDAPSGFEPCNGRDDDCNPMTTEADGCDGGEVCYRPPSEPALACYPIADCRTTGGSICGPGTYCGADGRCTVEMMGMECTPLTRDARCQSGNYCDATGACTDTLAIGQPCTSSVECASDTCFPNAAFGLPGAGGFCGVACCTNSDCVDGYSCLVPGTGARSCYPSGLVTGEPACSHDEDCGGRRCRALSGGLGARSQCSDPGIRQDPGGFCLDNSWCASGICFNNECVEVCQTHADCGSGNACAYSSVSPTVPHCVPYMVGSGTTGDNCGRGCQDALCWNDVCADACCTDDQCTSGRCIPIDNSGWEMRCVAVSVASSPG